MISRKTAMVVGDAYEFRFMRYSKGSRGPGDWYVRRDDLYDFLYENDYRGWVCNQAQDFQSMGYGRRAVKEWFMKLHTGESLAGATPEWSWEEREKLGQRYLRDFAEDILNDWDSFTPSTSPDKRPEYERLRGNLIRQFELDGYTYRDSQLLAPESDVLDVEEETGVLRSLYKQLLLPKEDTNFQFLQLSEEHYLAERWGDSISNSRKFLEGTLQEVAAVHSERVKHADLLEGTYKRAVRVRDYLERENLLDSKETETLAKVYGLLSETGSHPFMPHNEQARLLRHLALTFSQFVMIRLQGSLKNV